MIREEILLLSEENVKKLLTLEDVIRAAEAVFTHVGLGDITPGPSALLFTDDTLRNNFHCMPAILSCRNVSGVKWISTYSDPLPGYPFSHGTVVVLSDTVTGSPLALVGAASMTAMRTAGGHGVVQAKHLANPDPAVLSVMGCGAQAKAGIQGFLTQFPSIRQIRIFNRSRGPVEAVREVHRDRAEVVICDTPEMCVSGSNLILMASGAEKPLLRADMVQPGSTVIGIEAFRDMEPELAKKADKWYLGYRVSDQAIIRKPKLNPGNLLTNDDVFGDMTELLTGRIPGREREDEIIVSTHMGMGAHDVYCADLVYRRALEQGLGVKFRLA